MTAHLKRLQTKPQKEAQEQIEQIELFLSQYPHLDEKKVSSLLWDARKKANLQEQNTWTFIMISPTQNDKIVDWLDQNSSQPRKAVRLWLKLFKAININTGQIMLTRQEIAQEMDMLPRNVSTIMSELESVGAIIKEKEGRGVIYYMNPLVGTHLPHEVRIKAQESAPKLKLINGGIK